MLRITKVFGPIKLADILISAHFFAMFEYSYNYLRLIKHDDTTHYQHIVIIP